MDALVVGPRVAQPREVSSGIIAGGRHDDRRWHRPGPVSDAGGPAMNAEFFALALVAALNPKLLAVDLLMIDDRFVPDRLSLQHGVPYRLHLENQGRDVHEFTAPEFLADTVVRDPRVLTNEGRQVVVRPGETMDLFLMPIKPGRFRLICADHDWDGMVGEIVVK